MLLWMAAGIRLCVYYFINAALTTCDYMYKFDFECAYEHVFVCMNVIQRQYILTMSTLQYSGNPSSMVFFLFVCLLVEIMGLLLFCVRYYLNNVKQVLRT